MNYDQNNGFNNDYQTNNYNYPNSNMNNNMGNVNNNAGLPLSHYIKRFLIGFLLIAVLIFVLLWLFPTKQNIKDSITDSLAPLYDRIFQENIDTMKEVAIAYYTTERLPKKEGDTKKLTLGEMLEMKLLLAVKDKNGDMCDPDDSYVEITKMKKEYKMKVNLSCGDEEDYIIVYLGCYNYCLNDVCEKRVTTKKTQAKKQNIFQKVVSAIKNENPTPTPKPTRYYCAVVNGKYYDNKGNVVSKSKYTSACKSKPTKYYCAVVNGKYYNSKGAVVSKSQYESDCNKKPISYKYLYKKTIKTEKEYSNWTPWQEYIEYDPNNNNINWGIHEFEENQKGGYKTYTSYETSIKKPIYATVTEQTGSRTLYACEEYSYFIDITTNTTYITGSGGFQSQGVKVYSSVPSSSATVKYVFRGMSYSNCGSLCDVKPQYKFEKFVRSASSTSTTSTTAESLKAVCNKTVKKSIPEYTTFNKIVGYGVDKITTTKYYYHKRTRELIKDETSQTLSIWSYSKNDQKLIDQGYKYTGIYKKIESE